MADLRYNDLDTESATMLATIAKEKNISLCGITPDQTEAHMQGSAFGNQMGAADAILLTADLAVRRSLTQVLAFLSAITLSTCLSHCPVALHATDQPSRQ